MSTIVLVALCLVILCSVKVWQLYQSPAWKAYRKLPGPSYKWPFIGNFIEIFTCGISEPFTTWAKKYGPIFRYYMFGDVRVMVTDPAMVKHILLNNELFDKDVQQYHDLAMAFGKGLVTQIDESIHKHQRNIIAPAFALKHLKALVPIFQKKGAIVVEDWLKEAGSGKAVPIKDDIAKATSDVIGEAAFSYPLNSQRNNSPSSIYAIFVDIVGRDFNPLSFVKGLRLLTRDYHKRINAINILNNEVKKIISQKEENRGVNKGKEDKELQMRDLLDIMMDSTSEDGAVLTREELADQTKTFLLAGYETSSVSILWTMYQLARHPEIQQKLADEVISVIGKNRYPTAEDIDKMPYLYKVLRESLRICPPIPYVYRQATQDVMLGGYLVPKGTAVMIDIYHQHHNCPVWANPEVFDPERWTSDDSDANLIGSYLPFIMGARNCIGSKFAQLEIRVVLAMIVQKLRFEPDPSQKGNVQMFGRIALMSRTLVKLIFYERNN